MDRAFLTKLAILRKCLILNYLAFGRATFLQNDLGGKRPVTAGVKTLAAISLGASIKSPPAPGFKQLMNSMHLKYLQGVTVADREGTARHLGTNPLSSVAEFSFVSAPPLTHTFKLSHGQA
jgi:hypothetical protein